MHWTHKLDQYTCNHHFWPLVANVELSDGALYVADAANARWLMLAIAHELVDVDAELCHLHIFVSRFMRQTIIRLLDAAGNRVCSTGVFDRTLDIARFELRAGWTGNSWLLMLVGEDFC